MTGQLNSPKRAEVETEVKTKPEVGTEATDGGEVDFRSGEDVNTPHPSFAAQTPPSSQGEGWYVII